MAKGTSYIKYGKIELGSNEDNMDILFTRFQQILVQFGYPETDASDVDEDIESWSEDDEDEESPKPVAEKSQPWLKKPGELNESSP